MWWRSRSSCWHVTCCVNFMNEWHDVNKGDYFLLVRCLYHRQSNKWLFGDIKFLFECNSITRYRGWTLEEKFHISHAYVFFSMYFTMTRYTYLFLFVYQISDSSLDILFVEKHYQTALGIKTTKKPGPLLQFLSLSFWRVVWISIAHDRRTKGGGAGNGNSLLSPTLAPIEILESVHKSSEKSLLRMLSSDFRTLLRNKCLTQLTIFRLFLLFAPITTTLNYPIRSQKTSAK